MNTTTRKNIISIIVTIIILSLGLAIFQYLSKQKKSTLGGKIEKNERRKIEVKSYSAKEVDNTIEIDGRLRAQERVNITSKVQGLMLSSPRNIRVGKYFKKGELLYSIDKKEAAYNLKAQKSSFVTSITQMIPDIKFDYPQSFEKWKKYLSDFDINTSIQEMPKPSNDQEKYFIDGRNLNNLYYQIKSQETRLDDYNIYAPFSGVITAANIFPGSLISPGQILCSMINTNQYEIASPIGLENLKYIKVGQKVNLKSDGLNQIWQGKVQRIGTQIDESTQNIPLYISVTGSGLKDGMFLKGLVFGNKIKDVYELPKNIFLTPNSIYTVVDSTLNIKEVTTIKRLDETVIVKGILPNDKIVVSSMAGLFPGQKVNY